MRATAIAAALVVAAAVPQGWLHVGRSNPEAPLNVIVGVAHPQGAHESVVALLMDVSDPASPK